MTVQQSEHLPPISNHYAQKQWWFNKVNIFLLSQIIIHKNSDGSTKWTSFSISNHYAQKQWRFNKVNIFLISQIIVHKNSDGSTKWTSYSYLKSLYTRTVMVQQSEHFPPISNHYTQKQWWFNKMVIMHKNSEQSEHLSPISNHYTQKQWRFNKVNIFLLSQIIIHKNSDGSTKWTSFSYLKSIYTKTWFNKVNIFLLFQIIMHTNSDGSTKWTSFSYLKSLYTKTVTVQQSEHLYPISNHYTQKQWRFNKVNIYILSQIIIHKKQWRFNKVNIFLLSQIIIHKNNDGSTKWTSFSYLKSLYTKTVTVQQSEHLSPISNHYTQKQWRFNKVNIFLLSQIIMHKNSDGSTKWTSFSYLKLLYTKTVTVQESEHHLSIIMHKNSDGSTKWTSFSYLKSLCTKTVTVQQSEHLSPISNHYAQKQWRFNKMNIFLLSQIIIHKNNDGSTKWTSFSYLKSLYTKTVMVQQSEHLSPISNHYTQKQWRFNKVNIFLLSQIIIHKNSDGSTKWTSFSYLKSLYTKTVTVQQSEHLLLSQIIIHKNSDGWTSFSYLKSLYTKTVTVQQSEHLSPISNHYTQKQWWFNKVNIFLISQIIIHKNSDGSTKWTSFSLSHYTKTVMVQQSEHLSPISNHYAQKQWRFNKVNIFLLSQIIMHKNSDGSTKWTSFSYLKSLYTKTVMVQQSEHLISNHYISNHLIHKNSDGSTKWTSFSYLKSLYTKTVTVQQSEHLSPISNHYTQKQWRFNKVNIFLLSQIIIHKNSDGSTKWTSFSYLKSLYTKTVTVQQSEHLSPISNHYTQKQWWFNKVNIFLLSQIIIHKNSDGSTKWTSFSYLKSLYTKTVTVQQSEHLSPISNHYTQKQWWFNKVNIFLLSQIIIHKNSDGSTKWTSFSYLKSLYTKTVTVQQSEHLSPISNHYTQKQWRFNKVNIFLLSQIIMHKNSDGSTKWTSFSYLKSLCTKTVTVQQSEHLISNHYTQKQSQSEHLSPISNHYTQKQLRFNKVNIFLLSQIIIHKNSDGSTKWTSFSYLKSLYTKTVTVQQNEHLSPISNHYAQKQWRFNKVNIFLLSQIIMHKMKIFLISQIIIHKNSDGSTKWTSFSYLKSLYTKTVTVQQSEHLSHISNHYTQKQWRFNKVNIFLLSFSYRKSLYTKTVTVQQSEHLSPISNHYTQNSDGSTKWTSFSYLKSLYTKTVTVQQSEHLSHISHHYTQKQWRFNKVNIFLLSHIIIHKNSDGSTNWTSFSYLKSLYTRTVTVQQSEHLSHISNHYTQKQWRFNKVNIFLISHIIIHKNSDGSTKWTSYSYLNSLYIKTVTVQQSEHLSPISNHYSQKQWRFNKVNIFLLSQIIIHKNSDGSTKWTSYSYLKSLYTKTVTVQKVNIFLLSQIIKHKNSDGSTKWTSFSYLKSLYTKTVTVQQSEHLSPISNHYTQKQWRFNKVNIFLLSQIIMHKNSDGSTKWTSFSYLKSLYTKTVTVQQSEHLSPISNHYAQKQWRFNKVNIFLLSQIIIHKNSDGSTKWKSFSYLKSLYTKTMTVQQSEHLSPISNHYTQKQWWFNKVNIFLLSQIIIHKSSDGSTKWTSFSYLKSLYTRTVTVQQSEHLSHISNHYTQKQWRFNKVNIFLISHIIIHKNSDGSTKWTSFSYLISLYIKTVTVQQSEHLSPISNHYTQEQWRFNKVNIFLISQIIIHKNSDGSTKWTSFSYLTSLYTKTVMVQQSEHLTPISIHYT